MLHGYHSSIDLLLWLFKEPVTEKLKLVLMMVLPRVVELFMVCFIVEQALILVVQLPLGFVLGLPSLISSNLHFPCLIKNSKIININNNFKI